MTLPIPGVWDKVLLGYRGADGNEHYYGCRFCGMVGLEVSGASLHDPEGNRVRMGLDMLHTDKCEAHVLSRAYAERHTFRAEAAKKRIILAQRIDPIETPADYPYKDNQWWRIPLDCWEEY